MKSLLTILCIFFLTCSFAFGGTDEEDAALIKDCTDPVLQVLIQRGRDTDTVGMTVSNSWRGSITEGRSMQSKWDKLPEVGSQWIVMGRVQDDGFFHVELQYPNEKANWVQRVLGLLPPSDD